MEVERKLTELTEFKFDDGKDAEQGTFEGYASVAGIVDAYGDVVARGAFKKTLKEWRQSKRLPPMLHQHGGGMLGGNADDLLPIGKWTSMQEDEKGLHVAGKLINLDTERGRSIYGAMREGVLDGLSIGYRAVEWVAGTKADEPRRTLKAVSLIETSLVTMPANDKARVASVKSAIPGTEREFEEFLREAGFSRDAAKAICLYGFKRSEPCGTLDEQELAAAIRRNIASLSN